MEVDIDIAYQLEIFPSDRTNRVMFVAMDENKVSHILVKYFYWVNMSGLWYISDNYVQQGNQEDTEKCHLQRALYLPTEILKDIMCD